MRDLSANPTDVQFRLDTTGERRTFRIGERIPLTLAFWSDSADKYSLNGATYDRSGRLPTEEFVLERADVRDPYQDYFGIGVLGWIGGGLRANPVLESKPYEIELDLNDWFRFDLPGRHRFYLKSHRLIREGAPGESGERTVPFAAVSNIIEIHIVEEANWEVGKLAEIRTILDQPEPELPKPGGPPVPHNPLTEKIALAWRELRYLGTSASVQLAFEHARKTGNGPDTLLLVGARDRPQMVTAFDSYLADAQVGFRDWDVRLRALFTLVQKDAPRPLPMFRWEIPDKSELQKIQVTAEARQKRFEQVLQEEASRLIPAVAAKHAGARQISGNAIASIAPEAAKSAGLVPPEDYGLSREDLIAQFAAFPPEQQSELLGKKWDLVRGPEMVPVLAGVISKAKPNPLLRTITGLQVWGITAGLAESAMRRLTELSPQETARILREDIANGSPRLAGFAVREFPAQDIPAADETFSALLTTNFLGALPLVAKFATPKLADQIRTRYARKSWSCAVEEAFATYFVRVFPEEEGEGRDVLRRAMADREQCGCYRELLNRVAALVWNAAIEEQAIATLDDSEPEVVMSAVQVLAAHGGAGVERFLWKRLEQWSQRWRGLAAELEVHPITGRGPNAENQLGFTLFNAIASARSWVLDESRRQRLVALCVDDRCREEWGRERPPGAIPLDVSSGGGMYPAAFRVEGYTSATFDELKSKLLQFPAGTVFRWCPQAANSFDALSPGQRESMFQELKGFLSMRSMSIEPYSEEKCLSGAAAK